ncbi:MAG: acetoacetate--CoA ligase, partial [Myxococcaceae bacterium]|nr:acetoacetate--CoA ligase [Myxococcaceae bacterium]
MLRAMPSIEPGSLLWTPPADARERSRIGQYMRYLAQHEARSFSDYDALWQWSVTDLEGFWGSIARYFEVRFHARAARVLEPRTLPGAHFFPGATLNYAEHALARRGPGAALLYRVEDAHVRSTSWDELHDAVARARAGLLKLGVTRGDRVAALLPNCPEAVIGFLAAASLGATWSSCSPEFGVESVLDRFGQIAPKVLFA